MPFIRVRTHREREGALLVSLSPVRRADKEFPEKPLRWETIDATDKVARGLQATFPTYRFDVELEHNKNEDDAFTDGALSELLGRNAEDGRFVAKSAPKV